MKREKSFHSPRLKHAIKVALSRPELWPVAALSGLTGLGVMGYQEWRLWESLPNLRVDAWTPEFKIILANLQLESLILTPFGWVLFGAIILVLSLLILTAIAWAQQYTIQTITAQTPNHSHLHPFRHLNQLIKLNLYYKLLTIVIILAGQLFFFKLLTAQLISTWFLVGISSLAILLALLFLNLLITWSLAEISTHTHSNLYSIIKKLVTKINNNRLIIMETAAILFAFNVGLSLVHLLGITTLNLISHLTGLLTNTVDSFGNTILLSQSAPLPLDLSLGVAVALNIAAILFGIILNGLAFLINFQVWWELKQTTDATPVAPRFHHHLKRLLPKPSP
ncbi:MAG: hypothetical protein AAB833_02600 [Patescibacteria group bacterium]